ncbi:hypothetical protein N0V90_004143 [Kalmusia sp. IMI 367209]|nr:hypothetical protein N0V90_004143 [Kalmusia sp. IMI 367209]
MNESRTCQNRYSTEKRTFDRFTPGRAKFISVNDGEAQVPALLISQEMFNILEEAVRSNRRYDALITTKRANVKRWQHATHISNDEISALKIQIKSLEKSLQRTDPQNNEKYGEILGELAELHRKTAASYSDIKLMKRREALCDKEIDESSENVKKKWKKLNLAMEEAWKKTGMFKECRSREPPMATQQVPMPTHSGTSRAVERKESAHRARLRLASQAKNVEDTRRAYSFHMKNAKRLFGEYLWSKKDEIYDVPDIYICKDEFYANYVREAARLYQEREDKEALYTKEYKRGVKSGLEKHDLPIVYKRSCIEIPGAIDEEDFYAIKFHDRQRVDDWRVAIPNSEDCYRFSDERQVEKDPSSRVPHEQDSLRVTEGSIYPSDSASQRPPPCRTLQAEASISLEPCILGLDQIISDRKQYEARPIEEQAKFCPRRKPRSLVHENDVNDRNAEKFSSGLPCSKLSVSIPIVCGSAVNSAFIRSHPQSPDRFDTRSVRPLQTPSVPVTKSPMNEPARVTDQSQLGHTLDTSQSASRSHGEEDSVGYLNVAQAHDKKRSLEKINGDIAMPDEKRRRIAPLQVGPYVLNPCRHQKATQGPISDILQGEPNMASQVSQNHARNRGEPQATLLIPDMRQLAYNSANKKASPGTTNIHKRDRDDDDEADNRNEKKLKIHNSFGVLPANDTQRGNDFPIQRTQADNGAVPVISTNLPAIKSLGSLHKEQSKEVAYGPQATSPPIGTATDPSPAEENVRANG